MSRVLSVLLLVASLLVLPSTARAGWDTTIQKNGKQAFPGRIQIGFHPLGAQVTFTNASPGGYKLMMDAAFMLKDFGNDLLLWIGGGFNYTYGVYYFGVPHDIQIHVFAMLTINKINFPVVPFVRAGFAGDILPFPNGTGGGGGLRFGAGVHYWIIKNVGVGLETNFTLGGAGNLPIGYSGFMGNWDFGFGARVAL